jgi:hypothetical protein
MHNPYTLTIRRGPAGIQGENEKNVAGRGAVRRMTP